MEKTWKPVTAGILSIISGVVALLVGIGDLVKGELARRIVFHIGGETIGVLLIVIGHNCHHRGDFRHKKTRLGTGIGGSYLCPVSTPCGYTGNSCYHICGIIKGRVRPIRH